MDRRSRVSWATLHTRSAECPARPAADLRQSLPRDVRQWPPHDARQWLPRAPAAYGRAASRLKSRAGKIFVAKKLARENNRCSGDTARAYGGHLPGFPRKGPMISETCSVCGTSFDV